MPKNRQIKKKIVGDGRNFFYFDSFFFHLSTFFFFNHVKARRQIIIKMIGLRLVITITIAFLGLEVNFLGL